MTGIRFIVDELGAKKAVVIDLEEHGELWEDFHDRLIAEQRKNEPRAEWKVGERTVRPLRRRRG